MLDFPFGVLWPLIPGVFAVGSWWSRAVVENPLHARLLSPVVSLSALLFTIHLVSLVAGDFHVGLVIGIGLLGGVGSARLIGSRLKRTSSPVPVPPLRWPWGAFISAAVATAVVAPGVLEYSYHDEQHWHGHFTIASSIASGWYPPRHAIFPEFLLKYHYGINLLIAVVMQLVPIGVSAAFNLTSLVMFAYTGIVAWVLVDQIADARAPSWAPLVFLFAAGLPALAPSQLQMCEGIELTCELMSLRAIGDMVVNPPFVSNFFQHPWGLGVPIAFALCVVCLEPVPRSRSGSARATFVIVMTAMLSLAQVVLFLGLVGALVGAAVVHGLQRRSTEPLWSVLPILAGAAFAPVLGGFFVPSQISAEGSLVWHSGGVAGDIASSIGWHFAVFGLMIPFAAWGLTILKRGRLTFLFFLAGNLVIANSLRYRYSWDIVKFVTAASVATALLSIPSLRRLLDHPRAVRRWMGGVLAAGLTAFGLLYQVPFIFGLYAPHELPPPGSGRYPGLDADDTAVLEWLRRNGRNDELVFRRPEVARLYAFYGGLPQIWGKDSGAEGFGFDEEDLRRRQEFRRGLPECEVLKLERVRFVVVQDDEPRPTLERLTELQRDKVATQAFSTGRLRVFRIDFERCPEPNPESAATPSI